ncbi:tonB-dependent receptor [alpha proteobacterium U9-1i]|nr:tonB-dependent receptor [alpha proteobacterium U9-1i]
MKRFGDQARLMMLFASVCAAPFALCAPAVAQDAAVASDDEIVVTARRREESLQDVPLSISVQTGEALEQRGAENITALSEVTPNATIQIARGSNSTLIGFIRGVGQQDPLWGFEPGVGLYIDDVYIARPQGAVLDLFDINRIEVLRGPQGTLYGRNTIGGAIKYVTNRLDMDETELNARVALGSYNQRDLVVSGSAPLAGNFAVGGAMALLNRDGYGTNITTGADHYNKEVAAFRASAEWQPTDDIFIRFSADHLNDDSLPRHGHREVANGVLAGYNVLSSPYDTQAGIGEDNSVETTGYSLTAEWDLNEAFTVKSISAFREGRSDTLIDFDNGPLPLLDVPAFYEDEQFSQELQLLFEGDRIQGVAGLYYLNGVAIGAFDTIVGGLATTTATAGRVSTTSLAAYADVSIDLSDMWSMSLGGRWTQDQRAGAVYRQNFAHGLSGNRSPLFGNPTATPGLLRSNYANEATFEEFTPRVSLSFEPSDDLTLYASYGQGFKSGGFDMRGDVVLTPNTVNGYQPEFVDSYELGFHASLLDGRARLSGAVFDAQYTDQQVTKQETTLAGGIASFVDNAGQSAITGAELEGTVFITEGLSAVFAVGYMDARFEEFVSTAVNPAPPPSTIAIDIANIADIQNAPDWSGSFALNYTMDFGDHGSLTVTPSVSFRSSYQMFELATPLLDEDGYSLLNLSANWTSESERYRFAVHGQNLGDEQYKVGGYNFPGAAFGNSIVSFYGPPQTVTAVFEIRY